MLILGVCPLVLVLDMVMDTVTPIMVTDMAILITDTAGVILITDMTILTMAMDIATIILTILAEEVLHMPMECIVIIGILKPITGIPNPTLTQQQITTIEEVTLVVQLETVPLL